MIRDRRNLIRGSRGRLVCLWFTPFAQAMRTQTAAGAEGPARVMQLRCPLVYRKRWCLASHAARAAQRFPQCVLWCG
jgi:hypothetical protein